ncbi:MAG: 4-hydroxythreonine-4-phosphate dehydrogenase PdxA [Cytophagales bacterium]|nr:4-hydroxythreonine-4-phosphate dehydrogenase PdxA [Cytophagales bacterium]
MSESGERKSKIGISIGDVNGIGTEVIIKALFDQRITKLFTPVIYASNKVISFYKNRLDLEFHFLQATSINQTSSKKSNVINVWNEEVNIQPGEANSDGGKYAILSLKAAVEDLKSGKIDALVTAPINKDLMKGEGFDFPGHTEYLTRESGSDKSLMLLVHEDLRVGVGTGHIPVSEVASNLSKEKIDQKLTILMESLKNDFAINKPKVAILGLNPHAGEKGLLGSEDQEIILPVIDWWKDKGHLVFGPFPADGFFGTKQYKNYDGILAMYHDQGLIPFKTLAFDEGVNYTAGLSLIRTSPDHGTGYDIAGKNEASPDSFRNALYLALDIINRREETP